MVLIQWQGLNPEDTSWETWSHISDTYHLEDKVIFPGSGNVNTHITNNNSSAEQAEDSNIAAQPNIGGRPTRIKTRPKYLSNYE